MTETPSDDPFQHGRASSSGRMLHRISVGPLQQNCYLIADPEAGAGVLVDPGEEASRLLQLVDDEGLELAEVWLTHAHFDHVGAVAEILEARPVPLRMHPADEPLLERAAEAAANWGIRIRQPAVTYEPLAAGEVIRVGSIAATVLFTPGHAPGHVAFHLPDESAVIAGDALFRGSIGRTDLPLSDHETLLHSIRTQLFVLPVETVVHPGHGPATTIGHEVRTNPFLQ